MHSYKRRGLLHVAFVSLITAGGLAFAQGPAPVKPGDTKGPIAPKLPDQKGQVAGKPTDPKGTACQCSNPISVHILKNSGPTQGIPGEFRSDMRMNQQTYNATTPNTHFTETLQWRPPVGAVCEIKAQLTIKLKNLGTSLSSNDSAGVMFKGVVVPAYSLGGGMLWTAGEGAGATKTLTYQLTNQMVNEGRLSYYVQDDTAVLELRLDIEGCCINPTK